MPSQRKSDTARANGAKSKGPKTAETREISSRNSLKHGITSRHNMLLACEDPALFQKMVEDYSAVYQPANVVERDLVEEIIGAKWRIRRLKTIEVALIDYEMDTCAEQIAEKLEKFDTGIHLAVAFKGLTDGSRSVSLLSRYESRLHRIALRAHQTFMDVRKSIAAGLLAQPATPVVEPPHPEPKPEPAPVAAPAAASPEQKKLTIEPTIIRVLRRIKEFRSKTYCPNGRSAIGQRHGGFPGQLESWA